jgi:two-component system, LuxR family, sensor kinase FixL
MAAISSPNQKTVLFALLPRSPRVIFAAIVVWLGTSLIIIGMLVASEVTRLRQEFTVQSEATYEIIRQRLDQNDAVLAGVDALLQTFPGLESKALREYAHEMLARYPHIYMIQLQPRVELAELRQFEVWARTNVDGEFAVKDYDYGGKRRWHPAPPRPVYYPITFMEPQLPEARPVLGLDVHADGKFRAAIDETVSTGLPSVSAPFDLFEGGRAYLIFKVIHAESTGPDVGKLKGQLATRVVSLLIHTGKFLDRGELPSHNVSMHIYMQGAAFDAPHGQIDRIDAEPSRRLAAAWLPELTFKKILPSQSQPFIFETRRQLGLEVVPMLSTALTLTATLIITLLALAAYHQRNVSRTAAREAERRLFAERERALVTVSSIADAVLTVDRAGVVVYANPACERLLGVPQEKIVGLPIDDVVALEYDLAQEAKENPFRQSLAGKAVVALPDSCFITNAGESKVLIEGTVSPLFDQDGNLTGAVAALRDMGPVRKRALEALQASEQRLQARQEELAHVARLHTMGEMASGIAHELNQPLAAILSYNQACMRLLRESDRDFAAIEGAMRATTDQAKRAADIIVRLRAFISKRPANVVSLDMRQVVRNALVLGEPWLQQNEIKVEFRAPAELPDVRADNVQVEQVVLNLIRNAVEAMEHVSAETRMLTLALDYNENNVALSVKDSGRGVSPKVREKLFHPFHTSKPEGMGLGLTICQSIAETYGGTVVENAAVSSGAEFQLILPAKLSRKRQC